MTFLLIAILNLALGGSLFGWFYESASADCHESNEQLMSELREGPPKPCL